jgi:hypothetical protein
MAEDGDARAEWSVEYLPPEHAVRTSASGQMTLVLVKQKAVDSFETAADHGTGKLLVDSREVQPRLSTMEIYKLPAVLKPLGLTGHVKVALVYSPGTLSARDFEFFETVAVNQGYNVRLFTTVEDAKHWLRE